MSKMPSGSTCILYGALSEEPVKEVDPLLLIGRGQRLEGFMLPDWLNEQSVWGKLKAANKVQKMMESKKFFSTIHKKVSLFELKEAIPEYKGNMTLGKYLVCP